MCGMIAGYVLLEMATQFIKSSFFAKSVRRVVENFLDSIYKPSVVTQSESTYGGRPCAQTTVALGKLFCNETSIV